MDNICITCDRCGCTIKDAAIDKQNNITSGYYDVSDGYWGRFARWDEYTICDKCMHSDPKYKEVYDPNYHL